MTDHPLQFLFTRMQIGPENSLVRSTSDADLKVLLVEVTGINLRNGIGHGLDDDVAQREAALLIHCACHLRLLAPDERPRDDT